MPFKADLIKIKETYNCDIYLETGLYILREESSITKALNSNFDKVYSIEIQKKHFDYASVELSKKYHIDKYKLILDDSVNLKKYIVNNPDFEDKRAIFFLDAHVDSGMKELAQFKCPVIAELEAIQSLKRKDHIICIDDMRIIKEKNPWGEKKFDNFYDEMIKRLKNINIDYKIDFIEGIKENDVLIAYL